MTQQRWSQEEFRDAFQRHGGTVSHIREEAGPEGFNEFWETLGLSQDKIESLAQLYFSREEAGLPLLQRARHVAGVDGLGIAAKGGMVEGMLIMALCFADRPSFAQEVAGELTKLSGQRDRETTQTH